MNEKMVAVVIAAVVIVAGLFIFTASGADTEFPWGDADIVGTGVLHIEMIKADGTVIDVTPGMNPMAFFHGSEVVTHIQFWVTVSAVDKTGQFPYVKLDFNPATDVRGVLVELAVAKDGTTLAKYNINLIINPLHSNVIASDGIGKTSSAPKIIDFSDVATEGELTYALTVHGDFQYAGCDTNKQVVTDWEINTISGTIPAVYLIYSGNDIFEFDWRMGSGGVS